MVCEKCKTQIPDDSKFCKECGVRVAPLPKPVAAPSTLRPPSKTSSSAVAAPIAAPAQKSPQASAVQSPAVAAVAKPPSTSTAAQAPSPATAIKPPSVQQPAAAPVAAPNPAPSPAPTTGAENQQKDAKPLSTIIKYKLVFKVVSGGLAGKKYSVDEPTVINIGRGSNCMISISKDVDPGVSRNHCRLDIVPPKGELTDLGSSNGTYINEMRIEPNKKYELKSGDTFKVGENIFSVEIKSVKTEVAVPQG